MLVCDPAAPRQRPLLQMRSRPARIRFAAGFGRRPLQQPPERMVLPLEMIVPRKLLGGQHACDLFVGIPQDRVDARLNGMMYLIQLLAGIGQDGMQLRLLPVIQFQPPHETAFQHIL